MPKTCLLWERINCDWKKTGVFLPTYYPSTSSDLIVSSPVICFKKDTKILTFNDEKQQEEYVPIQELKIGTLIKTIHNYGEYKPIVKIKSLKILEIILKKN